MAAALYYLTIAAVILIGLLAGRRARSIIHAGLVGLVGNLVMVAAVGSRRRAARMAARLF